MDKETRLRELLAPFVHKEESRIDSFLEDDMEGFVGFVIAFHIEDEAIRYLQNHPNATTQELYHLIPRGLPPGDDGADLLEEYDD